MVTNERRGHHERHASAVSPVTSLALLLQYAQGQRDRARQEAERLRAQGFDGCQAGAREHRRLHQLDGYVAAMGQIIEAGERMLKTEV